MDDEPLFSRLGPMQVKGDHPDVLNPADEVY